MGFEPFHFTCEHCGVAQVVTDEMFAQGAHSIDIGTNEWGATYFCSTAVACANPDCKKVTLAASVLPRVLVQGAYLVGWNKTPLLSVRLAPESSAKPQPDYIPAVLREDYVEACRIRDLSPKASATLTRRCLQGMIRDFCGIARGTLSDEIKVLEVAIAEGQAPAGVTPESVDAIDQVRSVGNIGAHMEKNIDLIIPVDEGEAQILVDLVELLFEEWYVARHARQAKLASALTQTEGAGNLASLSKISAAGLVQTKGLGSALCSLR